jgi:hypothetical protein
MKKNKYILHNKTPFDIQWKQLEIIMYNIVNELMQYFWHFLHEIFVIIIILKILVSILIFKRIIH